MSQDRRLPLLADRTVERGWPAEKLVAGAMHSMKWNESFVTRLRELDTANESLFYVLGHLFDRGVECQGRSCVGDSSCRRIDSLIAFISRKLGREEALMERCGYPDRAAHCRDHGYAVTRLVEWRRLPLCHSNYQASLTTFLFDWTAKHIATFDRGLGRWAIPEPVPAALLPEASAHSPVQPLEHSADSATALHHRDDALAKWRNIAF